MGKPAKKNRTSSRSKARGKAKTARTCPDTSQASRRKAGSHGNGHLSQARELTVYECWQVCCAPRLGFAEWCELLRVYMPVSRTMREFANDLARYVHKHQKVFIATRFWPE